MNFGGGDFIQLMNGNGLDTSLMTTKGILCGMDSNSGIIHRQLFSKFIFPKIGLSESMQCWQYLQKENTIHSFLLLVM